MASAHDTEKIAALAVAAPGVKPVPLGSSKFRLGSHVVHTRFCSEDAERPGKFKFNINPNTLSADFELWVCGSASTFYLIPIPVLKEVYEEPATYVDRAHPEIRVVSVDAHLNKAQYASGGKALDLKAYLDAKLT
jgi:hypothetical protein